MRGFQQALAEDLRRFGLVLLGAGILTPVPARWRVLTIASGFVLLLTAYIVLSAIGDDA